MGGPCAEMRSRRRATRRLLRSWKSRAVSGPAVDESEEPGSAEAISSQSGVTLRPWFLADLNLIGASSRSEGRMTLLFQAQSPPPRRSRNFGHSDEELDRALRVGQGLGRGGRAPTVPCASTRPRTPCASWSFHLRAERLGDAAASGRSAEGSLSPLEPPGLEGHLPRSVTAHLCDW